MEFLQYQIWTSVKRSEKQVASKGNFSHFFQLNSSSFRLKRRKTH